MIIDKSLRSRDKNVAKVVAKTLNDGFSSCPRNAASAGKTWSSDKSK